MIITTFICSFCSQAQNFDKNITEQKLELGDTEFTGWKTGFVFEAKDVRKGFWKYCKDFSRPYNLKTHYKVIIPSFETGSDIDVTFYSAVKKEGEHSFLFVSLDEEGIPDSKISDYQRQLKSMMLDFKQEYYLEDIDNSIKVVRKELKKLGRLYERHLTRGEESERYEVGNEIKRIENLLEQLQTRKLKISG